MDDGVKTPPHEDGGELFRGSRRDGKKKKTAWKRHRTRTERNGKAVQGEGRGCWRNEKSWESAR